MKGPEDGANKSLATSVQANDLSKSSLGHQKNDRQSWQETHQERQIFSRREAEVRRLWLSPRVNALVANGISELSQKFESAAGAGAGSEQNHSLKRTA